MNHSQKAVFALNKEAVDKSRENNSENTPKPIKQKREPFNATTTDAIFALVSLVLGFLFVGWCLMFWHGWGVSAFTVLYVASVLLYAKSKAIKPATNSWVWLALLLVVGASFSIWIGGSLAFVRFAFLFGLALYWTASVFNGLLTKRTGDYLLLDIFNILILVPFNNLFSFFKSFSAFKRKPKSDAKERSKSAKAAQFVLLGLLICLPLFIVIIPLLNAADSGAFGQFSARIANLLDTFYSYLDMHLIDIRLRLFLTVPVTLYLYGLVSGFDHRRYTRLITKESADDKSKKFEVLPQLTAVTVLAVLAFIYLLFFATQLPYYFSAFQGKVPSLYGGYAAYARDGFFELCKIALVNLAVVALASFLLSGTALKSKAVRFLTVVVSALTLLFIITAFSKMALYITAYGLTPKRVLTSLFTLFLTAVWVGVIVRQYKRFSIMKLAVISGTALLCLLCLVNVDGLIIKYNAGRYIAGDLQDFELPFPEYKGGIAAAKAMLDVKEATDDIALATDIAYQLARTKSDAGQTIGLAPSGNNVELYWLANMELK